MTLTFQELAQSPLAETLRGTLGSLLQPISPDNPAGPSLRYDPLYDRVRNARHTESSALPQGVWQRDLPQADWAAVDQLTTEALERRSKDLQLALWRTEALLHLDGLPGLSAGLQLIMGLHCLFATTMHPAPSSASVELPLQEADPGVEGRLNLIQWMNDKLSVQLKLLAITAPDELSGVPAFTLADVEAARLQEQHKVAAKPGENRMKLFEQSLALTPSNWLGERWSELQHTTEMVFLLDDLLDTVYGQANGGLLKIKKVLEEMHTIALAAIPEEDREMPAAHQPVESSVAAVADVAISSPALTTAASEPENLPAVSERFQIRSRADAYRRLAEIAEFLSRLEPHSPVPYLLKRAIAWGGMSLEELLPELLADQAAMRDVGNLLRFQGSIRK